MITDYDPRAAIAFCGVVMLLLTLASTGRLRRACSNALGGAGALVLVLAGAAVALIAFKILKGG